MSGSVIAVIVIIGVASVVVPNVMRVLVARRFLSRPDGAATATPRRRPTRKWLALVPLVGVSLFSGLMVASVGGALYPPLTKITAPMICDGQFHINSSGYSYKPGQSGVSHQMTCIDPISGRGKDVTLLVILCLTLISAGVVFVPLLVFAWFLGGLFRRLFSPPASIQSQGLGRDLLQMAENANRARASREPPASDDRDIEARLRELLRLRERGLIDANDYDNRKAQILSEL